VAGKNRSGRSVGDDDGQRDDRFDSDDPADELAEVEEVDEVDDEAFDDDLEEFDDETEDETDESAPAKERRRSKVLVSRTSATRTRDENPGYFRRIPIFVREVYAELQKVIWPTRKELLTYTSVVVVFVAIMMTIVGLLDQGFAWSLLLVFGGSD
jgi:preprotein translocase subunit SecE